jgi:translin
VHALDRETAGRRLTEAAGALDVARNALAPFPAVLHAGFVHDAAKEYAEARATMALVGDDAVPGPEELGVEDAAWLNGVAEAASELRRHALDRLRAGSVREAEVLLERMDHVFGQLVVIEAPDALAGGLRRRLDVLRSVIERTRGDVTVAALQQRLHEELQRRLA